MSATTARNRIRGTFDADAIDLIVVNAGDEDHVQIGGSEGNDHIEAGDSDGQFRIAGQPRPRQCARNNSLFRTPHSPIQFVWFVRSSIPKDGHSAPDSGYQGIRGGSLAARNLR